jgi:4-amino-4-deoxy-L-arabinose transferase-like glycosyltransferase
MVMHSQSSWVGGDGFAYTAASNQFANGHVFVNPYHPALPTAIHPPVWPVVLGIIAFFGAHTWYQQQLVACVLGTGTVVAIGFAGRRIAGARVGLIGAAIAAVYAGLWIYERDLLSETLLLLGIAVTLLLAYRFRDAPSAWLAAGLGVMTGLLALTRSEQILIWAFLVVPLVLSARSVAVRRRAGWLALATASMLIVLAPWAIFNATRFQHPEVLSSNFGATLATANCDPVYYGPDTGYTNTGCLANLSSTDESVADSINRRQGTTYAEHHLGRLPVVVFAREGRAFGFWNPFQQIAFDSNWQDTPQWVNRMGLFTYWLLLVPAVAGIVALRRRRRAVYPLLAFVASVVVTVAATYGETRYRAAAEIPIVLLAAVGIEAGLRRLRRAGEPVVAEGAGEPAASSPPEAMTAAPADGAGLGRMPRTATGGYGRIALSAVAVATIAALIVAGVTAIVGAAAINSTNLSVRIVTPSNGATLSGEQTLAANTPTNIFVSSVRFKAEGARVKTTTAATTPPGPLDWVAKWNTHTVPNGTYRLWCVVSYRHGTGLRATSDVIRVVVKNG